MKRIIIISLVIAWVSVGCGTIKDFFKGEPEEDFPSVPNIQEGEVDENGNPIFTDDQLDGKRGFNWGGAFLITGLLIATGLATRHFIKND